MRYRVLDSHLKRKRRTKGMNQSYVAEILGIGVWDYASIERGEVFRRELLPKIRQIEQLFDCKLKVVEVEDVETIKCGRPSHISDFVITDKESLINLELLNQQIEREERERSAPFKICAFCKGCVFRNGRTCLVPICMKAYRPRDYGTFGGV